MNILSIYIQLLKLNDNWRIISDENDIQVQNDTVYIRAGLYSVLRHKLGEQKLDTILHQLYNQPYATYLEFKDRHPNIPLSIYNIEKRKYFP